ncbi:MAG: adenylate/guanylate cyclase domain-containing protein [Aeromicrobium sp.]
MTGQPATLFAEGPEGHVAYQVWGSGKFDLLFVTPWQWNIDVMWSQPRIERYLRRLGTFSRVITFDKRGAGVSDPVPLGAMPTLEQWTDDIRVVLDAAQSSKAAIVGTMEGTQMALLFAGLHPERTRALVALDGAACYLRRKNYPIGMPECLVDASTELLFGRGSDGLAVWAPSLAADPSFVTWWPYFRRSSASPTVSVRMWLNGTQWDVRPALAAISAPTLVLHHTGNRYIRANNGRYMAEHIRGAKFVELAGDDCLFFAGDQEDSLGEIEDFLTGTRSAPEHDRVLATVLFTDIVSSTQRATELGDSRWHELIDTHDRIAADEVGRFRGRLIKNTGDGILATFDGPARAIRCAASLSESMRSLGIEIRAGLHAGEVELRGDDIGGIAVHTAARVMGKAGPGEILVSSTVKDLVVGSGIEFLDRGEHELRGLEGQRQLFAHQS